MDRQRTALDGKSTFRFQGTEQRVGILGGTFNPPHLGHLDLCRNVYAEFGLDEILLLPVGTPPHKEGRVVASRRDRKAMTVLLAQEEAYLTLCDVELMREGYTYTVDTLQMLNALKPAQCEFFYIIGTDTLFYLDSWKDFKAVLPLSQFVCVLRPGDDMIRVNDTINLFATEYGKEILLSRHAGPDISSTQVRKRRAQKEDVLDLVPASIAQYMEEHRLYV